jgi:hypothetical protein
MHKNNILRRYLVSASSVALFALVLCAFLGARHKGPLNVDSVADAPPKLGLSIEKLDLGRRAAETVVPFSFELKNVGGGTLHITDIRPGCGCTVVELGKRDLAAGEKTTVHGTLTLSKVEGIVEKPLALHSDDPARPAVTLLLHVNVIPGLAGVPKKVVFGNVLPDVVDEKKYLLQLSDGNRLDVRSVSTTSSHVQAVLDRQGGSLTVRLVPPLPPGPLKGVIHIESTSAEYGDYDVLVSADVAGELTVTPAELELRYAPAESLIRYIVVSPGKTKEFSITSVTVGCEGADAQVVAMEGGSYRVRITNLRGDPVYNGRDIRIRTTVPTMPEIVVPICVPPGPPTVGRAMPKTNAPNGG